ncbi:hypothetical protein DSL72_000549 [Monilinia vaccinii-corymbosi]|uniref:NAD(P)-binding domain-containing protein n=1 Tax=Monilinia vaccinii-corymbosi TaxID=61207 RepID=A0A8A3P8K7_9HELO|nr:hypothetical protein DSL72_000549 [Monilinia vaccinii-corymbosi]
MPFDITIKKVALAGASGPVGQAILTELLKSELFDMTILTRDSTTYQPPRSAPTLKVIQVDYTSLPSLTHALANQDAVISTISPTAIPTQTLLITACIRAHVRRFLPSEYSYDFYSPTLRSLAPPPALFAAKIAIEAYLDAQVQAQASHTRTPLSYTLLFCNPLLELSLANNLFFDAQSRTATLHPATSSLPTSLTTLASLAKAVRRILTHPRETANRPIRIKDVDVSHQQLVCIAQSLAAPGEKWDVRTIDDAAAAANVTSDASFAFGGKFERVHNAIFGIGEMTVAELEERVRLTLGGHGAEEEKS